MKQHCWCNMIEPRRGVMIELEDATQMRDGIPLCDEKCAQEYDRRKQHREYLQLRLHNAVKSGG